jgi:hypothetical protein
MVTGDDLPPLGRTPPWQAINRKGASEFLTFAGGHPDRRLDLPLIHKQKKVRARNMRRLVSREFRWPATRQKLTGRCTTGIEEWGRKP